jgi:putative ATP-binding cassette transporter
MIKKYIILIIFLSILEASLIGYIGWWRAPFWGFVQSKNLYMFYWYLIYFGIAALAACGISAMNIWYQNKATLAYRDKLTEKALNINLDRPNSVEGQAQRIQEDPNSYPAFIFTFCAQMFRNVLVLGVYGTILVYQLSFINLLYPFLYTILGTGLAAYIAKPLFSLNYLNQVVEAKFRQELTKENYKTVHDNNLKVYKATKKLNYFQYFFSQISVIFPYLVIAPLYFTSNIIFGVYMQCASAMANMVECLSLLINNYGEFNKWLSCRRRLKELEII